MSLRDNYIFDLDENVTQTPVSYKNQFGSRAEATKRQPLAKAPAAKPAQLLAIRC